MLKSTYVGIILSSTFLLKHRFKGFIIPFFEPFSLVHKLYLLMVNSFHLNLGVLVLLLEFQRSILFVFCWAMKCSCHSFILSCLKVYIVFLVIFCPHCINIVLYFIIIRLGKLDLNDGALFVYGHLKFVSHCVYI